MRHVYILIKTWFRSTRQGGGGSRTGGAFRGRVAAGLGPQVRPDSQSLCHFHVIRRVDVVEHAAAGQLHLKRNARADQQQGLRHGKKKLKQMRHLQPATHRKNQYVL